MSVYRTINPVVALKDPCLDNGACTVIMSCENTENQNILFY